MIILTGHDRTYTVPVRLRTASEGLVASGAHTDLDQRIADGQVTAWDLLELSRHSGTDSAAWADRTLETIIAAAEAEEPECLECQDTGMYGIEDPEDPDILRGLLRASGDDFEQLTAAGWVPFTDNVARVVLLDDDLAREMFAVVSSGSSGLARRYVSPIAWLPPSNDDANLISLTAAVDTVGDGWKNFAIVDDLDTAAVLNLIRLAKGPVLETYVAGGKWEDDTEILSDLMGVSPPMLVELDPAMTASVIAQVDSSAAEDKKTVSASALVADLNPVVSPDPRAEKLRRYWSIGGKGGLKIKWGLPGDFRRCYRHLRKFMGVRAKGYCANMHKRNTGVWTGSKLNASATWPKMSTEAALLAAIQNESWRARDGKVSDMRDGIYTEASEEDLVLNSLLAGGFPVAPPDEWFSDPKLSGPTPLITDENGRVYGHIATFDVAHIGMPGKVHAPRSRSDYAFFRTGEVVTASGAHVPVGQLTLAGGHAPLHADAGQAVSHYDNTASAVADIAVGEDRFGIWAAGALRPEVTPEQVRALRASAPSGDWRPINGNLELVAICQVNVPGFPVARARVASGAIMALVAAGARPLALARASQRSDSAMAQRIASLEAALIASGIMAEDLPETESETETVTAAEVVVTEEVTEALVDAAEEAVDTPVSDETRAKIERAREASRARRSARNREALRARVHRTGESVAASAAE